METFRAFEIRQVDKNHVNAGFRDYTRSQLDDGEVEIRVVYSDINYKDALAATGKGRILLREVCVGGIDLAGIVVRSEDPGFAVGQRVLAVGHDLGVRHHGGYAELARVPAAWVVKIPETLSLWEAMALGTAGYTAGLAIERLEKNGLRPEQGPVLVNGATGGVGSLAIAALAQLGYDVHALTGKANESAWLKSLGARTILLRQDVDLARLRPLGSATWAAAIDNLGGPWLAWLLSTTQFNGAVASVGLAADAQVQTTVMPFILRGVSLLGINSTDAPTRAQELRVWERLAHDLRPKLLQDMAKTLPFAQLPAAFDDFLAGNVSRRVVVQIGAETDG